jgi:transcriptional regulator with XRE-family HTH domain
MTFPERLKFLRKERHLTQKQLAEKSGLGETSISGYERNRVDPTGFALCCMADVLHVTVDYLLGRTDKK